MVEITILGFIDLITRFSISIAFLIMLIIHIYQARKIRLQNYYFLLAMLFGTLAFILLALEFIIENADWTTDGIFRVQLIIFSLSTAFVLATYFFYFWYRHYEAIVNIKPKKPLNIILIILLIISSSFYIIYLLGFYPDLAILIVNAIPDLSVQKFFTNSITVITPELYYAILGRIVTVSSNILFPFGIIVTSYVVYLFVKTNLKETNKSSNIEFLSIILFLSSLILYFLNNFGTSFSLFTEPDWVLPLNNSIFLTGMTIVIVQYIVKSPPHILNPSLQLGYFKQLKDIFTNKDISTDKSNSVSSENNDIYSLTSIRAGEKRRLTAIAIEVLLYLLAKHGEDTYAKEIENDLQLKKATVSYNLHILEEHNLINRDESILQKDQRLKSIKISPTGISVLLNIYQSLINIFSDVVS